MVEHRKYKGYLLTELVVSMSILVILLACLALSLNGFRRFNNLQLTRQRCTAAALAQLDSIVVTGKQINREDFERLWPNVSVSIKKSGGMGQWKGLERIKVKTTTMSFNKNVEVELSRYIEPK